MNPARKEGKTLVLGLGNDILTDDAIGLLVVRELQHEFALTGFIECSETVEMGLTLLDFISGYDGLVLIDSVQTGQAAPGSVQIMEPGGESSEITRTPHFLGVPETIALGRALGFPMPSRTRIYGIEVQDPFTLGTTMTSAMQTALPGIVRALSAEIVAFATEARASGSVPPSVPVPGPWAVPQPPAGQISPRIS